MLLIKWLYPGYSPKPLILIYNDIGYLGLQEIIVCGFHFLKQSSYNIV